MKVYYKGRIWHRKAIQELIMLQDNAFERGMRVMNAFQSKGEVQAGEAIERNGKGWSKYDASFMTRIAGKLSRGDPLTRGQRAHARVALCKYWKQLLEDMARKPGAEVLKGRITKDYKARLKVMEREADLEEKERQRYTDIMKKVEDAEGKDAATLLAMKEARHQAKNRPSRKLEI